MGFDSPPGHKGNASVFPVLQGDPAVWIWRSTRGVSHIHRPIRKESVVGKHTERLSPTPHVREELTQDEEWLKSMVDHPAGRRCHGDEGELDLPFLDDGDEPWRVPLEWILTCFACLWR